MRIRVSVHYDHLVSVELRPNMLERLLLGMAHEDKFAVRAIGVYGGYEWTWDQGGAYVGDDVQGEILRALAETRTVGMG